MHPHKIDVEPLSEQRWTKIEAGLFERLDREPAPSNLQAPLPQIEAARPWRWKPAAALVLAGAMAAAIGALVSKSFFQSPTPPLASSRIVTTGADSHVAVGESEVDVSPDSAVVVTGDDARGVLVVVDRGKVDCEVAPRKGRPPFVVQAGDVRVRVVGTHFTVARDAQGGGAHVSVSHGVVEVTSHGQTVSVHAGDEWPAAPSPPPAPTAQNTPPVLTPQAGLQAPAPALATPRTRARHAPRTAPQRAPVAQPPIAQAPVTDAPVAPPPPPEPPPPAAPARPPAPSAQELYESANRMEASNPDGAIVIYGKLAAGSGPWAANALYAAGRLQADRGRRGDATRLLNEYLTRYPNGANARDARDLLDKMR